MITRIAPLAALAVILAQFSAAPAQAGTIYNVVEYTDPDFSISGTIMTDGTFGGFQPTFTNFLSWTMTFTDPSTGFAVLFDETSSSWEPGSLDPAAPLSVSAADIVLNRPSPASSILAQDITLRIDAGAAGAGDDYLLSWATSRDSAFKSVTITSENDFSFFHQSQINDGAGLTVATATADVPEPGTIVLLMSGGLWGVASVYRRRRLLQHA